MRVTILDTKTWRTATEDSGEPGAFWYWQEGNGSCDCNRAELFDDPDPNEDEFGRSVCRGCHRYVIVDMAMTDDDLDKLNCGYPPEVRQMARHWRGGP